MHENVERSQRYIFARIVLELI